MGENELVPVKPSSMRLETHVEDLVEVNPSCLGEALLIIKRQLFGRVDLLAIDATGRIRVIEFKRGETPRETITQTLEYLLWVQKLSTDEILDIFAECRPGVGLAEVFFEYFGCRLPAVLNQSQVITIVAATVDPTTKELAQLLQHVGFSVELFDYRYYRDIGAIEFRQHPQEDRDTQVSLDAKESGASRIGRPVSAGELARWHASLDHLGTSLEEFRPTLEALKRPSSAATTYGPVASMRGIDQYILHFWQTYAWRFAWDFVPFSFLYELYEQWLRTQAAAGLHLPLLEAQVFGRRLAAAATATGEWTYDRRRPENLMDAPEPLTELLPGWKRPEAHQSVNGYVRSGIVGRRGESRRT